MNWLEKYDLFLFDFDGLLVNTESLHKRAYELLCRAHGCELTWSFAEFCSVAHAADLRPQDYLLRRFPQLAALSWEGLYEEKCHHYEALLKQGACCLMPGVEEVLQMLEKKGIERCVVTHSRLAHIDLIRKQLPILNSIPHWITREDYKDPKPDPDCYLTAWKRFAKPKDRAVGFEDTPRGVAALRAAASKVPAIDPVWVAPADYPLSILEGPSSGEPRVQRIERLGIELLVTKFPGLALGR